MTRENLNHQGKLQEKLAEARARAATKKALELCATRAYYDAELCEITIILSNGVRFSVPTHLVEGLADASSEDLAEVEVTPSNLGLHWEKLDVDLSLPDLMNGIFGTKKWMMEMGRKGGRSTSAAKADAARLNGQKGGRPPKRQAIV